MLLGDSLVLSVVVIQILSPAPGTTIAFQDTLGVLTSEHRLTCTGKELIKNALCIRPSAFSLSSQHWQVPRLLPPPFAWPLTSWLVILAFHHLLHHA